jgi:replication-associated recombination protein RarA
LERKLWDRLCVISVEDVGFGNVDAPVLVQTLWQMAQRFGPREGDRYLFPIHAVRVLCACPKDRSTDEMLNYFARSHARPNIPKYALDMHTARGQKLGHDFKHFMREGAKVEPELPNRNRSYLEKILALLEAED